jgi:hypothetical protein
MRDAITENLHEVIIVIAAIGANVEDGPRLSSEVNWILGCLAPSLLDVRFYVSA